MPSEPQLLAEGPCPAVPAGPWGVESCPGAPWCPVHSGPVMGAAVPLCSGRLHYRHGGSSGAAGEVSALPTVSLQAQEALCRVPAPRVPAPGVNQASRHITGAVSVSWCSWHSGPSGGPQAPQNQSECEGCWWSERVKVQCGGGCRLRPGLVEGARGSPRPGELGGRRGCPPSLGPPLAEGGEGVRPFLVLG